MRARVVALVPSVPPTLVCCTYRNIAVDGVSTKTQGATSLRLVLLHGSQQATTADSQGNQCLAPLVRLEVAGPRWRAPATSSTFTSPTTAISRSTRLTKIAKLMPSSNPSTMYSRPIMSTTYTAKVVLSKQLHAKMAPWDAPRASNVFDMSFGPKTCVPKVKYISLPASNASSHFTISTKAAKVVDAVRLSIVFVQLS
eukprot:CAMPEP_0177428062 /NCGR_PEP_ID=MMETSP0368-20130122/74381_1 /TAXON_ID=447022 ORGANISM="Scrippsiella hangoei-like, Strain SHHI-4" /NCGR_SAMPLE_ID=MMETSP0368 /ASSEMBLY_ACC=CAM_ASM_000363 /LENGTH=197 /DNA_ID=CAMNT_0018898481 /DNA_START=55 /DNA_END=644 /DNA_ORIENTATION=-